ncbi:MAG TPA: hypothetical protein VKA83_05815 [Methylomirabilota bacterium]|jgi:hypothetical protein|nr:hypothetical protein [Methylomirabilota bacterium]
MARLHALPDAAEIAKRRKRLPPGRLLEAWPDLYVAGQVWVGDEARALLETVGGTLAVTLSVDAAALRVYYGPRLSDVESLPLEESLRARVLSARGIAVAWISYDQFGQRTVYEPTGPADPIFYLRRPGGTAAHIWRLFRTKPEARAYMAEYYGRDSEGRDWAAGLPAETFDELLARHRAPD